MSEINSIAQGTYTLGQTSATTYQAGPGIKIDSPSEGTVRISNDETVLFATNDHNNTSAALSEPASNFERVKINFGVGNDNNIQIRSCYNEFNGTARNYCLFGQRTDAGGVILGAGKLNVSEDFLSVTPDYGRYFILFKNNTSTTGIGDINFSVFKVIGINRISGGN